MSQVEQFKVEMLTELPNFEAAIEPSYGSVLDDKGNGFGDYCVEVLTANGKWGAKAYVSKEVIKECSTDDARTVGRIIKSAFKDKGVTE